MTFLARIFRIHPRRELVCLRRTSHRARGANTRVGWLFAAMGASGILAHAAAPDPYARPTEDLYTEPGQTWTKNSFTHSEDIRLLDSGIYVSRLNIDVAPGRPFNYTPGTWTRSGERIILSFPGAAKPVMELQPMMVNGCRALVPVASIAERGTLLAMDAYRLENQDCPHYWDN